MLLAFSPRPLISNITTAPFMASNQVTIFPESFLTVIVDKNLSVFNVLTARQIKHIQNVDPAV